MNLAQKPLINEDWLSLWIGLFVFVLSLGLFVNADILGWGIKTNVWSDISLSTTSSFRIILLAILIVINQTLF